MVIKRWLVFLDVDKGKFNKSAAAFALLDYIITLACNNGWIWGLGRGK